MSRIAVRLSTKDWTLVRGAIDCVLAAGTEHELYEVQKTAKDRREFFPRLNRAANAIGAAIAGKE